MFHKFKNQKERKKFGATAFVEFTYCKNKSKFKILNNLLKRKKDFLVLVEWLELVLIHDGFWIYGV